MFKINPKILLIALVQTINASVVAVLEIIPSSEEVQLSISEFRHLTDELRTQAREALPRNYTVLTRDNIFQLLPPDEAEAECLAESCAVIIGRAIGAEYVTQGNIGKFGEMLTLTVELYESMSSNLLGSFVTESKDIMGLLGAVRERAPGLFARMVPSLPEPSDLHTSAPHSPLPTPQKSRSPFFIALSLDLLGATALGIGVYQHSKKNKHYNEHLKLSDGVLPAAEKYKADREYDKAESARKFRNAAIITGSVLLASGITVHIWF
ncbi:MAG: hypothetical protein LBC85_06920 [Fibromonadaceae bacterium]|jgi:hypothetical protein|nr:hypothetical protein [Fibromonadaceae bacterium]